MFDLTINKNSFGDIAYKTEINEKENINNFSRNYKMNLPGIDASIQFSYGFKRVQTDWDKRSFSYKEYSEKVLNATIKIGDETFQLEDGGKGNYYEEVDESKAERFIAPLVHAVVAYDYVKKNANKLIINAMDGSEILDILKSKSIEELDQLAEKIDNIQNKFLENIKACVKLEGEAVDSQVLFDEEFGEGKVNLDKLVEKQADLALEAREIETIKENALKEKLAVRQAKIDKIKGGLAKLLDPVRMIKKKLEDMKSARIAKHNEKEEKRLAEEARKAEEARREALIDRLNEM